MYNVIFLVVKVLGRGTGHSVCRTKMLIEVIGAWLNMYRRWGIGVIWRLSGRWSLHIKHMGATGLERIVISG